MKRSIVAGSVAVLAGAVLSGFTTPAVAAPATSLLGCTGSNSTNVAIPDYGAGASVDSSITIEGCSGNASATSTVEVHIVHPRIGDLMVVLVAPNGIVYTLHDRTGGQANNIDQTYTLDLSDKLSEGTWDLTVWDERTAQVGYIDSWTLTL